MEFTFSIRGALKEAWTLFKKHLWFFVGIAAVSVVLNFIGGSKHLPVFVSVIISIFVSVASFVWSIVMMKFSLAAADGKEDKLSFKHVKEMLPSWKQAIGFIGVGLFVGLLVLGGFILLIIPGIWIAFRLSVANLAYLDKEDSTEPVVHRTGRISSYGVRKAVRASWDMTKGSAFWTAVLVCLVGLALYLVGFILLGVGILVTYPLAMILMAKFYRALTVHHAGLAPATVVVQPKEIVAPVEAAEAHTEEHHHESETPNQ